MLKDPNLGINLLISKYKFRATKKHFNLQIFSVVARLDPATLKAEEMYMYVEAL